MANSEDPDEMLQNVTFHPGVCTVCLDKNNLQGLKYTLTLKAPPIICIRRQFQILLFFQKIANKA